MKKERRRGLTDLRGVKINRVEEGSIKLRDNVGGNKGKKR